jgi:thiamine kinase-like enzyme
MRLSAKDIHHYLLDKGFIDARSLVDGDYAVHQSQTRNAIFRIVRRKQKSLFVKQLIAFEPNNTYALQKDATCLWLIKNEAVFQDLAGHVPEYFGFDPERQVLVTEYIPEARNLEEYSQSYGTVSDGILTGLAKILAGYHFPLNDAVRNSRPAQFFPKQIPWALSLGDLNITPQTLQFMHSQVPSPVLNTVIGNPEFQRVMAGIKDRWESTSLIHGDIKWMNLLVSEADGAERVRIIDWEIADIGDPLWDVAGLYQGLIMNAMAYGPRASAEIKLVPALALDDLTDVWPKMRTFWQAYVASAAPGRTLAAAELEKAVQYTGVRLVQTAMEHNMMAPDLQPRAVKILQASYLLLSHVPAVVAHLTPSAPIQ